MDRRSLMTGMWGTAAASLWTPPDAFALGLPKDKIKRVRYYKTPTDAAGRPNVHQPTFNQSTNVVTIETESGLIGIGEGGEPSSMQQLAGLIMWAPGAFAYLAAAVVILGRWMGPSPVLIEPRP